MFTLGIIIVLISVIIYLAICIKTDDKSTKYISLGVIIGCAISMGVIFTTFSNRTIKTHTLPTIDTKYEIVNNVCVDTTYIYHFNQKF